MGSALFGYSTATFIGHGDLPTCNIALIEKHVEILIAEYGCRLFLLGGMGRFDMACAYVVRKLKRKYPHVQAHLVIPYLSFSIADPLYYDEIIFPEELEGLYYKRSILERNRYLVDHAEIALCYVDHCWGGAYKTYQYAKKKNLPLIELSRIKNGAT